VHCKWLLLVFCLLNVQEPALCSTITKSTQERELCEMQFSLAQVTHFKVIVILFSFDVDCCLACPQFDYMGQMAPGFDGKLRMSDTLMLQDLVFSLYQARICLRRIA
jgi:hypothetical protein